VHPKSAEGWTDDPVSRGKTAFGIDQGGKLHIVQLSATGRAVDVEEDGAVISVARLDPSRKELVASAVYEGAGVVESFMVTHDAKGGLVLLWTLVRDGEGAGIVKGGSYLSRCEG